MLFLIFVTFILVVGYSWIDAGHLIITVNFVIGIGEAWRWMPLVLVGIATGVIVMLFARPPSTREAVQLSFAN